MGGDRAPGEIVAGARRAVDELGLDVILVGVPDLVGDTLGLAARRLHRGHRDGRRPRASPCGSKKDSSLVRAAELVRDGAACAMVSAGNTGRDDGVGAAAHGADQGRGPPVHRHAAPAPGRDARRSWSTPGPTPSARPRCSCSSPRWRARFVDGAATAWRAPERRAALDRRGAYQGHAARQGDPRAARTPRAASRFDGNVEGRDLIASPVDVVVTDGFTGNVALKTLEGALRVHVLHRCSAVIDTDDATRAAGRRPARRTSRRVAGGPRPRRPGRGDAARRRRRLRDLPRLLVRHARS